MKSLFETRREQREPEPRELAEPARELERVPRVLVEVVAGVEHDAILGHAVPHGERDPLLEERGDLADHVVVLRGAGTACRGCAAAVRDHEGRVARGDDLGDRRIVHSRWCR